MKQRFEVEFNYENKTYIATGGVDFWDRELIGTTFGEETEVLSTRIINHVEIDTIDRVCGGDYECMMDNKRIKEIAVEAIIEKVLNN